VNLGLGWGGATTALSCESAGLKRIEYSELNVTEEGVEEVFIGSVFDLVDGNGSPEA